MTPADDLQPLQFDTAVPQNADDLDAPAGLTCRQRRRSSCWCSRFRGSRERCTKKPQPGSSWRRCQIISAAAEFRRFQSIR